MSKYKNKKIRYNEYVFDSKTELKRYIELLKMQENGEISNLERQVPFILIPAFYEQIPQYSKTGKRLKDKKKLVEREVTYKADFVYIDNKTGEQIVEDTKGFKTAEYIVKRKLMLYIYGIRIKES